MWHQRGRILALWIAVAVVVVASGAYVVSKGPAVLLRWAVRTFDPALRLDVERVSLADGEFLLKNVVLRLRGIQDPIFQAKEISAGLGADWRQGRYGSLVLVSPMVSLDKKSVAHFVSASSGNGKGGWGWELGRLEIRGGHVWLQDFGKPAVDVSLGVDGVVEHIGTASLDQWHELDLSNIYIAVRKDGQSMPLLGAGKAELSFSLGALLKNELGGLRVDRGWLLAGEGLQAMVASESAGTDQTSPAFLLRTLDLVNLHVSTGQSLPGVPALSLRVNSALRDVGLGTAAADLADKIHQVEFADIEIVSPYDPLKRAVTVRSLFARFTLSGLARQEIEELILLSPTIFVGEALFEYMQTAEETDPGTESVQAAESWKVKHLDANFGKLMIAVGGRSQVGLPLTFQTSAQNVSLSSLAGLNLNLVLNIPPDDYDFPDYDISFKNVRGDILLNYPPDQDANNLVNVVKVERGRWRNFTGRNLWVSVTFDLEGISGKFGGEAYGGYVSGGFVFLLQPESPWTGWLAGSKLNLGDLTAAAVPQHFMINGNASMKVEVNGRGPAIDRVSGKAQALGCGRMVITKLDDMIEAISPDWSSLKQELARVSLESLRDYDYTEAGGEFWFVGKEGRIDLKMKGPSGVRNLGVVFHGPSDQNPAWSRRQTRTR